MKKEFLYCVKACIPSPVPPMPNFRPCRYRKDTIRSAIFISSIMFFSIAKRRSRYVDCLSLPLKWACEYSISPCFYLFAICFTLSMSQQ